MEYRELTHKLKLQQMELHKLCDDINQTTQQILVCIESKMYKYSQMWIDGIIEHPDWMRFRSVWFDKYVSEDYTDEMILDEINKRIKSIEAELKMVEALTQNDENAIHIYKTTLDFEKATKR